MKGKNVLAYMILRIFLIAWVCLSIPVSDAGAEESYFPCPVLVNAGLKGKLRHVKKWGYIDKSAKLVIENQFDFAQDFNDGFAYVWKDNKLMIINTIGKVIWEYNILNGKIK